MALFEVAGRITKEKDKALVSKAKTRTPAATIRGGNDLLSRINQIKAMVEKKLGKYQDRYVIIQDEQDLINYLQACVDNNIIAIDTETTGLNPLLDAIAGVCIYTPGQKGAYIPINHRSYITQELVEGQLTADFVKEVFTNMFDKIDAVIMFNANFDIRVLRNQLGISNAFCTWDCYLAARLMNENEPVNSLKKLHQKYVLKGAEDAFTFEELFKGIPFTLIPIKTGYLYAARDPEITYELYDYQRKYLYYDPECTFDDRNGMNGVSWVFFNIEMPCVEVVTRMEDNGVLFDKEYNLSLKEKYHTLLDEREANFIKICNTKYKDQIDTYRKRFSINCKLEDPINIKSADQLAILLYDILQYPLFYDKQKKKNTRSTAEEALEKLDTDISRSILSYREFSTLVSTFIDKLPECVNPNDGRIHCTFNQLGADTGRMSSSDPNLQNIPSHNEDIRKMFVASPGYVLMSSDFSQQEPKCLAALCRKQGDSQMYNTFMAGKDLYGEIASKSFNKSYEDCLEFYLDENGNKTDETNKEGKQRRSQAKGILLGVLYGRGDASVAEKLKVSLDKAKEIKNSVFKGFPAIKKFEQDSLDMAYNIGYVTTVCGRKRRLPDLQLDEYEFKWKGGKAPDNDLLDFSDDVITEVPESKQDYYWNRLNNCRGKDWQRKKQQVFKEASDEGIIIVDNGAVIAAAKRQCVNARIQGSAADLTKLAMIKLNNSERLKELGFRLLIPVHDEIIAECPEENVKECANLLADTMSSAAESILEMPIKCDVVVTHEWYGEKIEYD